MAVEDANKFTENYLSPGNNALGLNLSNAWFNSAKAKTLGNFEISLVSNISLVNDDQRTFMLNEADYEMLRFQNGPSRQLVGNALGENNPDIGAKAVFERNGIPAEVDFDLPQGLANSGLNFVPGAMIQASVGLIAGFEIKGRYLPEVKYDDIKAKLFGVGLKHEFTSWLPLNEDFPFYISGFIGYNNFNTSLEVKTDYVVENDQQWFDSDINSWNYSALVSTKFSTFNFYGSIGYINTTSTSDMIGTYRIDAESLNDQVFKDPISINSNANSLQAVLGFKLDIGFFKVNGQYSFQKYNTLSLGLNFEI